VVIAWIHQGGAVRLAWNETGAKVRDLHGDPAAGLIGSNAAIYVLSICAE